MPPLRCPTLIPPCEVPVKIARWRRVLPGPDAPHAPGITPRARRADVLVFGREFSRDRNLFYFSNLTGLRRGSRAVLESAVAMNPDLEGLIRLQHADTDLRRVDTELGAIPKQKEALKARLAEERSRLDAARAGLGESQKARRQLESELQDLEGKRSKYKGQLMD